MKAYIVENDRLISNIEQVKKRAGDKIIYAVVKGNGYGLGLVQFSKALRERGINHFAVTEPSEALKLRQCGLTDEEILVLRSVSSEKEAEEIIEAKATATVGSYDAAVLLNGVAEKHGEIVDAHIKLDTGMGRYGFLPGETDKIISIYKFFKNINAAGLYTHFPCAFIDEKKTRSELAVLLETADKLRSAGLNPNCVHAGNSSSLFKYDLSGTDAVRVGSAFTGRLPFRNKENLQLVGHAECDVAEIKWLPKGCTIGYGSAFKTVRPTRIAVLPFGYEDGFTMERGKDLFRFRDKLRYGFSDFKLLFKRKRLYVTIRGKKATVLGHVGMAHTIADVTDLTCELGDTARIEVSPLYASPLLERIYR